MKTVVITGGCGGLGYFLTEHYLREQWRVIVVDVQPDWGFGVDDERAFHPVNFRDEDVRGACLIHMENISPAIAYNPELMIHCAEENDPSYNMMHHSLHTNLAFHWDVLSHAAKFNIRTIVPLWSELRFWMPDVQDNDWEPWISTIMLRDRLVKYFDRGNAVITPVYLPRFLSPLSKTGTWGSLVKRFYNAVLLGEMTQETSAREAAHFKCDPEFSQRIEWIDPISTVKEIVHASESRSRKAIIVKRYLLSAAEILGYLFDRYGSNDAIIPTKGGFEIGAKGPLQIESLNALKCIAEVCDEWDRERT